MKRLNLYLSVLMLLLALALLAGCGQADTPSGSSDEPAAEEPAAEEPAAEEPAAEEPAAEEPAAASDEPVTLQVQWWGSQDRHDRTIAVLEQIMEEHPNIEITYEFTGFGDYWTSLATKAAGGNLPDVIQQDYAYFKQYADDGLIVPLEPFVEAGLIDLTNVPDVAIEGGRVDGQLYALSLGTNTQSFLLDQAIFEEAGVALPEPDWTWTDFEETAMAIHEATGKYGVGGGLANPQLLHALYLSLGEGFYNREGTGLGFTDPQPLTDYFSMLVRLQEAGAAVSREDELASPPSPESNALVTGEAAMYFAHTNQFVAIQQAAGEDRDLIMVPVPRAEGATQSANYLKPSQFFSISSHSDNPETAAMVINTFTNSEAANELLGAERGVPVSTTVADAIKPLVSPAAQQAFDFLASVEVAPIWPPDPAAHNEIQTNIFVPQVIDPLMFGQITPEAAAELYMQESSAVLAAAASQ